MPFHQDQLDFMIHLAKSRIECLDPFFRFLAYFDSPYFFFVLIPVLWIGFSYQWGMRVFYWFTVNNLLNSYLKYLFGWSRPSTDLPSIGMQHPTSYGFPSGGAQTCMFLGILLIYYWKKPAAWIIGSAYILLISFSRLYLGVHYPIDVLGGWVFAIILAFLFIKVKKPLEYYIKQRGPPFSLALGLMIPLALMVTLQTEKIYYIMGATMGVTLGSHFSLKHHLFLPSPTNMIEAIGRSVVGVAITFAIVLLLPKGELFIQSFAVGLFMSLVVSPMCKALKKNF